ncbi:MAG: HAMP domain-containing histidine kinase [Acidimicrobiales bacterium]|nr:HAMP domain-containing histidine kinase [Acidimicrobiales bacterium]
MNAFAAAGSGPVVAAMEPVGWSHVFDDPTKSVVALVGLTIGIAVGGWGLRAYTRRSRSLRGQVLAVTMVALALGFHAAVLLAQLMVIDGAQLARVGAVLAATAIVALGLAFVATIPLANDVHRIEATVRRIEAGDREVRTDVRRADELGHVARALDELTERLDRLESERSGLERERAFMLSSIGHDLRTPLTALRAAIEAVADGVAPDPDRYLRSMLGDVEVLATLVDDFFLLARIEAGRGTVATTDTDLSELVDEAIEALRPVAQVNQVSLRLDADGAVPVVADPTALGRVVRNLVENAIRHAPDGTTVAVSVDKTLGPTVRVVDDGPGFPPDFTTDAFGGFTRADPSRARATGGVGLGLAIAKGLVEAHGGRIWIEDPPGGRVAFELPDPGRS